VFRLPGRSDRAVLVRIFGVAQVALAPRVGTSSDVPLGRDG